MPRLNFSSPEVGDNASVSLAGKNGKYYVIENISFSYSSLLDALETGNLHISQNSTEIINLDLLGEVSTLQQLLGFQSDPGNEVEIVLKGVPGKVARLSIGYTEYSI